MLLTFVSFNIADKLAGIVQFALVLGIMVIVHELGHFLAAKACGVRVEAFAIGFGKRLFGFVHNNTDYRVNLFPVGGYVKMAGMELSGDANPDDPTEFQNHPRWQRVIIAVAGPVFNFILAFALLIGLYMAHHEVPNYFAGPTIADYVAQGSPVAATGMQAGDRLLRFDTVENPTFEDVFMRSQLNLNGTIPFSYSHAGQRVDSRLFIESKTHSDQFDPFKLGLIPVEQAGGIGVDEIAPSTPAAAAGLKPGDTIVAIDGRPLHSVPAINAFNDDNRGKPVQLTVERSGSPTPLQLGITPTLLDTQTGKGYRFGFSPAPLPATFNKLPFAAAVRESWQANLKNSTLILDVLHRLFTRQVSVKSLSSPLGMGVQVHRAFNTGSWNVIIETMAVISLNLGIFNLLPIPILDGGMIVFLFIESLMRRDVSPAVKERVFQVAFVCILLFAAMVLFNDVTKMVHPGTP